MKVTAKVAKKFNVRKGIELQSEVVKFFVAGDELLVLPTSVVVNPEGDVRIQMVRHKVTNKSR
jgi:hypothetical protein